MPIWTTARILIFAAVAAFIITLLPTYGYDAHFTIAAESRALTLGSQEAFDAALWQSSTGSTEVVNGFRVFGNKGLVGDAFNRNIFLIEAEQKGGTSLRGLVNAFEAEARSAGASQLNIVGHSIVNEGFMNPAILERFGFTFRQINNETIFLSKTIKP